MAIEIECFFCHKDIHKPSAIILSPPTPNDADQVVKMHICDQCYFWAMQPLIDIAEANG